MTFTFQLVQKYYTFIITENLMNVNKQNVYKNFKLFKSKLQYSCLSYGYEISHIYFSIYTFLMQKIILNKFLFSFYHLLIWIKEILVFIRKD